MFALTRATTTTNARTRQQRPTLAPERIGRAVRFGPGKLRLETLSATRRLARERRRPRPLTEGRPRDVDVDTGPVETIPPATSGRLPAGEIVYDGGIGGSRFEVFTMHADGTGIRQLTDDARYNSWWPRPSPDGTRIAFYNQANVAPTTYKHAALWMMNADGTNPQVILAQRRGRVGRSKRTPNGRPDGTKLVFTAATTQALITTIAPDGSNLRVLGGGPGANVDPSFSSDGAWVFSRRVPIVDVQPDNHGGLQEALRRQRFRPRSAHVVTRLRDQDPVVSPTDSGRLPHPDRSHHREQALRGVAPACRKHVGANVHQITTGSALESAPRWSPGGTAALDAPHHIRLVRVGHSRRCGPTAPAFRSSCRTRRNSSPSPQLDGIALDKAPETSNSLPVKLRAGLLVAACARTP